MKHLKGRRHINDWYHVSINTAHAFISVKVVFRAASELHHWGFIIEGEPVSVEWQNKYFIGLNVTITLMESAEVESAVLYTPGREYLDRGEESPSRQFIHANGY